MTRPDRARHACDILLRFAAVTLLSLPISAGEAPPRLPPILFVSRAPIPEARGEVLGLGPHQRAVITRGRLLVRATNGSVSELLPEGTRPRDVSDPTVSPDGAHVAFAAVAEDGARWRIFVASTHGSELHALEPSPAARDAAYDDLDPCWIDDRTIVFASTREQRVSEYAPVPVTNLYVMGTDPPGAPRQITFDRNGAEEPTWDARHSRIVYSRWWFNRHRPSRVTSLGITDDPALSGAADTVNLWHAVSIDRDGNDLRLVGGAVQSRRGTMAYQPAVLADGRIVGVYSLNTGLSPRAGSLGIQELSAVPGESRRIAGALLDDAEESGYGTPRGLTAPGACSPAAAPGGRILFAHDPGGRGDFGIWIAELSGRTIPIVDLPGTLELDPVVLAATRKSPAERRVAGKQVTVSGTARTQADEATPSRPVSASVADTTAPTTFEYFCRNVFMSGGLDTPIGVAPPFAASLRIRFFALGASSKGTDSLVLVREAAVRFDGSIRESGLPADQPLFEQLIGSDGTPLATAHGFAQVPGYNFGRPGGTARCVGCHNGHSMLPADAREVAWFDAAPSAEVTVTSNAAGTAGAAGATDRMTRGEVSKIAWVAAGADSERVTLAWKAPIEIRDIILHAPRDDDATRTRLRMRGALRLWRGGREVSRIPIQHSIAPLSTPVACGGMICDRVDLLIESVQGTVLGKRAAALAEIEVIGRLVE